MRGGPTVLEYLESQGHLKCWLPLALDALVALLVRIYVFVLNNNDLRSGIFSCDVR